MAIIILQITFGPLIIMNCENWERISVKFGIDVTTLHIAEFTFLGSYLFKYMYRNIFKHHYRQIVERIFNE
jgi:hypothetical protein